MFKRIKIRTIDGGRLKRLFFVIASAARQSRISRHIENLDCFTPLAMTDRFNRPRRYLWLFPASLAVVVFALLMGPMGFDLELLPLRSSRVLLGMLCGAALGITGCALQAVMRNALADPYVLGVSGGAAAFGTAAIVFIQSNNPLVTPFASWLGSIIVSFALVYFIKRESSHQRDKVILLGVAINAFASAFITVIKTLAPMRDTQTLLFWLIGSIGYVDMDWLLLALALSLPCFIILFRRAQVLELLSLGDEEAIRLGVDVAREKRIIYMSASCLIGVSVSMCGMIAFVGLITPHLLKPFIGTQHRILLPASMILGLIIVTFTDTLSRLSYSVFSTELPVGAILAFLGAPIFVWILSARGADAQN